LIVLDGLLADHEAAVRVWHAANVARLLPPSVDRVARIWEKLAEAQACLVIGHLVADREVVAMALAEPGRAENGAGTVIPDYGHVSMVFVHPDLWDGGSGASCCRDFTNGHPKEAGTARRCGPGRRTRRLDGSTTARDTEGQANRRPLAAVIPSSNSSVTRPDLDVSAEDPATGQPRWR
jgi:hypothetical protein